MGETVEESGGGKETIVKAMGVRKTGRKVPGGKATGGKGDRLMSEREPDNSLPLSDKAAGQNVMEGIHRRSYSEAVIEGVRKRARVFVGDSIVGKTDRVLNKGDDVVVCLPGAKIETITEGRKHHGFCGFVWKFCWKGGCVHEGRASFKWKGGSSICGWTHSSSRQWHGQHN